MADGTRELFEALDQKHPDYQDWEKNWGLFEDVLGDSEPTDDRLKEYFPQGEFETDDVYKIRRNLTEWIPESGTPVNKLIGAIYNTQPVRDFNDGFLNEFSENVDFKGTKWADFIESVARRLIGYGTIRLLVNVPDLASLGIPSQEQGRPLTVADEQRLNIRPYLIDYSPLSVRDWEVDRFDIPNMVRIKEVSFATPANRGDPHNKVIRFIEYTRATVTWWEFRETKDRLILTINEQVAEHNLGVVPMIIENYPEQIRPLIGKSFIRYIARNDKRKIRAESDLHYDTYVHAHPVQVYKGVDELGEVGVGATTYLKIKPDEDMSYLQLPPSSAEAQQKVIEMNLDGMHRHAGTDPLGQMTSGQSVFQASGVARAWSFGTSESRILKDIASKIQRIEEMTMDLVLRWRSSENIPLDRKLFTGSIKYPDEFDPSSAHQLLEGREKAGEIINSPTLHKTLDKRIALSLVGETSQENQEKIIEEIDTNEPLDQGGSATPVTNIPQIRDLLPEDRSEPDAAV